MFISFMKVNRKFVFLPEKTPLFSTLLYVTSAEYEAYV
jgi:hypothetical protein